MTLVYGLASPTWVISSQALWKHGVGELSFAFLLYALLRDPASRSYPVWVGVALAVATANTLPEGVMILPFLVYFGRQRIRSLLRFLAPLAALGIPVVMYNWHFLGNPLMAYPAYASAPDHAATFFVRTSFADAFAGLLVNRTRPVHLCAVDGVRHLGSCPHLEIPQLRLGALSDCRDHSGVPWLRQVFGLVGRMVLRPPLSHQSHAVSGFFSDSSLASHRKADPAPVGVCAGLSGRGFGSKWSGPCLSQRTLGFGPGGSVDRAPGRLWTGGTIRSAGTGTQALRRHCCMTT